MMMVSDVMKIALVTEHLSLAQVPKAINKDLITRKTTIAHRVQDSGHKGVLANHQFQILG